jgi:TPR repeat protein
MSQGKRSDGTKGSKKGGVRGGLVCAYCKKVDALGTMKCCSRCKRVHYCSVECQKLHWKIGGHKKVCGNFTGKEGGSGARGDGAGASGGGEAPLQNPCPICLDNEDNDDEFGMCNSCGQMYCGKCNMMEGGMGSLDNCPTCRAVLDVSDQEEVRRLWCLLERPCGRYTPVAQDSLGSFYENGTGVDQDYTEAARLFRLAADQGHANSLMKLALCYIRGTGVDQNHPEAVRLYRLAADQGYASAQTFLATSYATGMGVDQDYAEAVRVYRLAVNQGYAPAQYMLGMCIQKGAGVDQDHIEAVRLYQLAANQGDADARYRLGVCYENGAGVDEDHAEAVRFYRLAADQGSADAQQSLARLGL